MGEALEMFQEHIDQTVKDVLSNWSISNVTRAPNLSDGWPNGSGLLLASIGFKGFAEGEYQLCCQSSLANQLTRQLLGNTECITDEMECDTLRELLNVLTGNFLVRYYGADVDFKLEISNTSKVPIIPTPEEMEVRMLYWILGHPLLIIFKHDNRRFK